MSSTSRKSETEPLRVSSAQDYRVPAIWLVANVALAAIAFALFLGRLVINHSNNLGDWGYSAGEWLINYQGGFVRRGLLGELLTLFPDGWQLTMTELWVAGVWLGVVAAFALLIGRTIRHTLAVAAGFLDGHQWFRSLPEPVTVAAVLGIRHAVPCS